MNVPIDTNNEIENLISQNNTDNSENIINEHENELNSSKFIKKLVKKRTIKSNKSKNKKDYIRKSSYNKKRSIRNGAPKVLMVNNINFNLNVNLVGCSDINHEILTSKIEQDLISNSCTKSGRSIVNFNYNFTEEVQDSKDKVIILFRFI